MYAFAHFCDPFTRPLPEMSVLNSLEGSNNWQLRALRGCLDAWIRGSIKFYTPLQGCDIQEEVRKSDV